jgi:hypothetical protein
VNIRIFGLAYVVSALALVIAFVYGGVQGLLLAADPAVVLVAGALGLVTYLVVNGLGDLFEQPAEGSGPARSRSPPTRSSSRWASA